MCCLRHCRTDPRHVPHSLDHSRHKGLSILCSKQFGGSGSFVCFDRSQLMLGIRTRSTYKSAQAQILLWSMLPEGCGPAVAGVLNIHTSRRLVRVKRRTRSWAILAAFIILARSLLELLREPFRSLEKKWRSSRKHVFFSVMFRWLLFVLTVVERVMTGRLLIESK